VCEGLCGGGVAAPEVRSDDVTEDLCDDDIADEVRSDDVVTGVGGVTEDDLSEEESWEVVGVFLLGDLEEEEREEDVERIEEVERAGGGGADVNQSINPESIEISGAPHNLSERVICQSSPVTLIEGITRERVLSCLGRLLVTFWSKRTIFSPWFVQLLSLTVASRSSICTMNRLDLVVK
jgi:hypothetical protein